MTLHRQFLFLLGAICLAGVNAPDAPAGTIVNTRHNLSISGPGPITAASEDQICIFCHMPRIPTAGESFLWNRAGSNITYTPYHSSTLKASVGQPTGSSRICLSCHDGTIAFGALLSEPVEVPFAGGIRLMPEGSSRLGTDLSDDHPVSFVYDPALAQLKGELKNPAMLPPEVHLDKMGELQCTACHDPHDNDNGQFLVLPNNHSQLCTACHDKTGWSASSHALSNASLIRSSPDMWPNTDYQTVAENGCQNCHRSHTAGRPEQLLIRIFEEDNCLVCHDGNIAASDIETQLARPYNHPVQNYTGIHDAAEDFGAGGVTNHVECQDCHNPHQVTGQPAAGPGLVSGATQGVTGIDASGQSLASSQSLFEICFKCHADNNVKSTLPITRQIAQLNTRLEFDPANPSLHPVGSTGVNADVPSLLPPYTTSSIISCIDCHNTSDAAGPKGPHGSQYQYLLADDYRTTDDTPESATNYALCYQCHSRTSILNDDSFKRHRMHIEEKRTPCSVCHDPHGINTLQGNTVNNSHLINFDLTVVLPYNDQDPEFRDNGVFSGSCVLVCHGKAHDQHESYQYP